MLVIARSQPPDVAPELFIAADLSSAEGAIKRVIQRSVTDSGTRRQLLLTGNAQWAADLSPLQLQQASKSPRTKVVHVDSSTAAFLPLTLQPPWNDPNIRHAIAQAIPYADILNGVFKGRAKPYQSILLPFLPGYTNRFAEKTNTTPPRQSYRRSKSR